MLSPKEFVMYQQQINLKEIGLNSQVRIKNTKVLCVGAGSLGTIMCTYLAKAGVGHLGIIDGSRVSLDSLHRSAIYCPQDLGYHKALISKREISRLNPYIEVTTYTEHLLEANALSIIGNYDIIADCSNTQDTHFLVNDSCYHLQKPYLLADVQCFTGKFVAFTGTIPPCYRCICPKRRENSSESASASGHGIMGTISGTMGIIQANEILKMLTNTGETITQSILTIDLLKPSMEYTPISQNPCCDLCSGSKDFSSMLRNDIILRPSVNYQELQELQNSHEKVLLIDVRRKEEYEKHHIPGAINIPYDKILKSLMDVPKQQVIVLYCQSGAKSTITWDILNNACFQRMYYLHGGITSLSDKTIKAMKSGNKEDGAIPEEVTELRALEKADA